MTNPAQKTSPSPGGSPWRLPQLRHRVAAPLIVVLLAATIGRLLVVSPEIAHGETALLEGLDHYRNAAFNAAALALHTALAAPGMVLIIAVITGWLAVFGRRPLDATAFFITSLLGWAAVGVVKLAVGHPRPAVPTGDNVLDVGGLASFPSGHTGGALAVVLALTLVSSRSATRNRILLLGLLGVVLVGTSQIYAAVHYPLDVLVSLPVAWAGVMLGCALSNTLVPALAFGFGWRQQGITAPDSPARSTERAGADPTVASSREATAAEHGRPEFMRDNGEDERAA